MKKLCCILMAIAMLCSLMVVNASAAYTYEGEMFKLKSDYEINFSGGLDSYEDDEYYSYFCWIEELDSEIEISIDEMDYIIDQIQYDFPEVDTCEEYYELYKEYNEDEEEILIDGIPAFVNSWDDEACCFIEFWSDNYYFQIDLEACDNEALEIIYDLFVDGFEITDSTSWYGADDADTNKADKTDADDKDEEENPDSDNTTIIIVAIVVAGVVVIAVAAIVVLGKKKK